VNKFILLISALCELFDDIEKIIRELSHLGELIIKIFMMF